MNPIKVLIIIILAIAAPSLAWSPQTSLQIASDAQQFLPTSMKLLIERNWSSLLEGISAAVPVTCPYSELPGILHREAQSASALISKQKPFSDVIYRFGYIAELVQRTCDPFMRNEPNATHSRFVHYYAQFVETNLPNFRLFFRGFADPSKNLNDVERISKNSMAKAAFYLPHLTEAYQERLLVDQSLAFDERSIPFGVSSVMYNKAVIDVATIWILIWQKSGGDLSGMKFPWKPEAAG